MKRLFLFTTLIFAVTLSISAQNSNGAFIATNPDTVKLGEIGLNDLSDDNGKVSIAVVNNGNLPLILNEVSGCCGTNVKEWPKAPILPGKTGLIKVEFRIEPRPQVISRTVTIKSNAVNAKVIKIPIEGLVIEEKKSNEIHL
ncbi:MAG: DUF1573 domain-containing protein [Bacteroidales bacterium]|nr:MAG: DUF1573 domain-containing protein [Bacteroidales bacterium]